MTITGTDVVKEIESELLAINAEVKETSSEWGHLIWLLHQANTHVDTSKGGEIIPSKRSFGTVGVIIKRSIRKLLKPLTRLLLLKQVRFNGFIVNVLNKSFDRTEKMNNLLSQVERQISMLSEAMTSVQQKLSSSELNVRSLRADLASIDATFSREVEQMRLEAKTNMSEANEMNFNNLKQYFFNEEERMVQRIEKIRSEIFHEISSYTSLQKTRSLVVGETQYVNRFREKIDQMGGVIKLNLGCGRLPLDGYLNVDGRPLEGVDLVADIKSLPFEPHSITEIYCAHLVEHFEDFAIKSIVDYWRTLLTTGGRLRIVCPDWEAMIHGYVHGEMSFSELREVTFGGQEYAGNYHFNMFTTNTLIELLKQVGFTNVTVVAEGRRNGMCLEMEVVGTK